MRLATVAQMSAPPQPTDAAAAPTALTAFPELAATLVALDKDEKFKSLADRIIHTPKRFDSRKLFYLRVACVLCFLDSLVRDGGDVAKAVAASKPIVSKTMDLIKPLASEIPIDVRLVMDLFFFLLGFPSDIRFCPDAPDPFLALRIAPSTPKPE